MPVEYQHLVWEIEKGFEAFWTNLVAFSDLVREVKKQRRWVLSNQIFWYSYKTVAILEMAPRQSLPWAVSFPDCTVPKS